MTAPLCQTTGRRKRSVARVRFTPGSGAVTVNGRPVDDYFPSKVQREALLGPLEVTETAETFDIDATIHGGGTTRPGWRPEARHRPWSRGDRRRAPRRAEEGGLPHP